MAIGLLRDQRIRILGLSSFFFFISFNMIIPELPDYLSRIGGADYKGMIIGLFAISAGLARPFSGKLTDSVGRVPVLLIGCLVCLVMGFLYPLTSSVAAFLMLRFFHGFSTGFKPTADVAYLADIVPAERRGEAMGLLGIMNNLGMSMGPALGSEIAMAYGTDWLFWISSLVALAALIPVFFLPETLKNRERVQIDHIKIRKNEIWEPAVKLPALITLLTVFSFGAVLTLIPDYARELGLKKQGYFYMVLTLVSLSIRMFSGKLSDRKGREYVMKRGTFFLCAGLLVLAFASNSVMLLLAAAIIGISSGLNSPTLFAWAIDKSHDRFKGRGIATLYIALEAGIALGSIFSAAVWNNESAGFTRAFLLCFGLALLALVILISGKKTRNSLE